MIFPKLSLLWDEVDKMTVLEAEHFLQEKVRSEAGATELLGMKISGPIISVVGPLLVMLVLAYLIAHYQFLFLSIPHTNAAGIGAGWISLFPGRIALVLCGVEVILIPTVALVLLLTRSLDGAGTTQRMLGWFLSAAAFALSLAVFSIVVASRRRLESRGVFRAKS